MYKHTLARAAHTCTQSTCTCRTRHQQPTRLTPNLALVRRRARVPTPISPARRGQPSKEGSSQKGDTSKRHLPAGQRGLSIAPRPGTAGCMGAAAATRTLPPPAPELQPHRSSPIHPRGASAGQKAAVTAASSSAAGDTPNCVVLGGLRLAVSVSCAVWGGCSGVAGTPQGMRLGREAALVTLRPLGSPLWPGGWHGWAPPRACRAPGAGGGGAGQRPLVAFPEVALSRERGCVPGPSRGCGGRGGWGLL